MSLSRKRKKELRKLQKHANLAGLATTPALVSLTISVEKIEEGHLACS